MDSCIYSITNTKNGKTYIGSALSFRSRKATHISKLSKGIHINRKLQNSWNKYGESSFEFNKILLCVSVAKDIGIDQGYLSQLVSGKRGKTLGGRHGVNLHN